MAWRSSGTLMTVLFDEIRSRAGRGGGVSVLVSGAASMVARLAQTAATLLVFSWALPYLGVERFGTWMTLAAAFGLLGTSDLGITNGVINLVAQYRATSRISRAKVTINAAVVTMTALAVCLGIALLIWAPNIRWEALFAEGARDAVGADSDAMAPVARLLGIAFAFSLLTTLFTKIRLGCNEAYRNAPWDIAAAVVTIALTFVAIRAGMGYLWVVAASVVPPIVAHTIGGFFLFGREHRELAPCPPHMSPRALSRALKLGALFFALQVGVLISYQIDSLVLAKLIGPGAVSEYSVVMRMFMLVPNWLGLVLVPLWPAYASAKARGDWRWIRIAWLASTGVCAIATLLASAALLLWHGPILRLWIGDAVRPDRLLILAFATWATINGVHGPVAMVLNGLSIIRFQVFLGLGSAVVNLVLSILLTRRLGVSGVVWGSIAQSVIILVPSYIVIIRVLHRSRSGVD